METFTWGIIGPGNIATDFSADLELAGNAHHRLGAILHHDIKKAEDFAEKENVPLYFDNIAAFLRDSAVDAVYIATPHPMHHQQAIACLEHRIPVLCEKPLAINSRQVQEMINASIQHNTFLLDGMWIRFLPSINKLLELIESDTIGKIRTLKADMSYKAPYDPESRYFNPALGGGSLLDLGIYPVFLSHLLLGKPAGIQAYAKLSDKKIDETCAMLFHYQDGAHALLESSLITQTELIATVYGETGKLTILSHWNEKPPGIVHETYEGEKTAHPLDWKGRGLHYEMEELYNCVRQGRLYSEKLCHRFSLDLMETLDTIRQQTGIRYPADE
ncbi:MAG: Gfo/Idh/MocA family oxidoreductase [Candidatus Pseudobacter hemicellulosilyticus]|uniref:Gfo/Idh/MocA family oxidoreductase n=1 Tax=Candidatus Pseudobacter hemicellulosilyticus TaxID=3121375 RepID=A0AAJ5WS39_9BACT|nr:MAG: Gfo/Idh/MocA family oxidoreductase [Pseudobacter sp.]